MDPRPSRPAADPARPRTALREDVDHGTPPADEAPGTACGPRVAVQVAGAGRVRAPSAAGDYEVDEFGYGPALSADVCSSPALRPLFEKWFRVEVRGVENIRPTGVRSSSPTTPGLPIDALMTSVAVHDHHPRHRALRMLAADLAFEMPVVGNIARKAGHTLACPADAERLLRSGEVAAVSRRASRASASRSPSVQLQRFAGRILLRRVRAGVPIVPCSIVGSEEIYPKIGDIAPLARLLEHAVLPGAPLFPHLGPLGLVPLPSKWFIDSGRRFPPTPTTRPRPTIRWCSRGSRPRPGDQSSRRSTGCWRSAGTSSWADARIRRGPVGDQLRQQRAFATAAEDRPDGTADGAEQQCGRHADLGGLAPGAEVADVPPRFFASSRRSASGLTATAVPTSDSIGTSL